MRNTFTRLLGNPVVFIIAALIYVSTLGPALISAPSTIAVLLGLAIAGALVWWLYKLPSLIFARKDLGRKGSGSDNSNNLPTHRNY